MKAIYSTLILIFALAVSACSTTQTSDIKVQSNKDPKANFAGYNTYAWAGYAAILNDPDKSWVAPGFDINAEIKHLIDTELRAKGMTEKANKPDVVIGYALGVDMANMDYKKNPEQSFETLQNTPRGGLVLMMVDPETGFAIWASVATAEVQGQPNDVAKKRLEYTVKTMLESLPK